MIRRTWGLALALTILSCGPEPKPVATELPRPNGAIAVSVASEHVTSTSLAAIADTQRIPLQQALDHAIFDAVLAAEARRRLGPGAVELLTNGLLARALMTDDWRSLRAQPISQAELDEATGVFWTKYLRPEGRRTGHAVVMVKPEEPPAAHQAARAAAKEILEAVTAPVEAAKGAPKPEVDPEKEFQPGAFAEDPLLKAFLAAARAVKRKSKLRIVAEELPAITQRSVPIALGMPQTPSFDPLYTTGAWGLSERGALSGVVKSSFGYHVIVLLEKTAPNLLDDAARREALRDRILEVRGKRHRAALLKKLEQGTKIELAANHAALLGLVDAERPGALPKGGP